MGNSRANRTAKDDRQRLRDHFVVYVGPQIKMHEFVEADAVRFVRSLADRVAKGDIAPRTAGHGGVVRTMFRDARLEGVSADPFACLPRKLLPTFGRGLEFSWTGVPALISTRKKCDDQPHSSGWTDLLPCRTLRTAARSTPRHDIR
jgi:hypothetical protein